MTIDLISLVVGAILWELFSGYLKGKKEERDKSKGTTKTKSKKEVVVTEEN